MSKQRAVSFSESLDVAVFIVALAGLPASVDDADPLAGELSRDGMVTVASLLLLVVKAFFVFVEAKDVE